MSLEGFCYRDYFLNRQLFVFQSYCTLRVYINVVGKHFWCCIHKYYLHNENGFRRDPLRWIHVCMDAKTFHQICLSILQPYPSLISAKGKYMSNDVSHAASSSLCSLLQSFFHLPILIY